ncbi:hypothetical protein ACFOU0_04755 [Salinicoccus sesuvii]|uniref:Uncharacterized protein n=1 Tax=Salinicoccus sesuvii TaxID=868281 RepID=A0ABV7N4S9_9STAP
MNNDSYIKIDVSKIEEGKSMVDEFGKMYLIDYSLISSTRYNKQINNSLISRLESNDHTYIFKCNRNDYGNIDLDSLDEKLYENLKSITLLNEKNNDFQAAWSTLNSIVIPNIFGINDLLGYSTLNFTTFILKPSVIELTLEESDKVKTTIFTVINVYENGFIECFHYYCNTYMRVSELYQIAHINTYLYQYSNKSNSYKGKSISILDENSLDFYLTKNVLDLLSEDIVIDKTIYSFIIMKTLTEKRNLSEKLPTLNLVFRPIRTSKKATEFINTDEIASFKNIHFFGNKNHSFIYADKNIRELYNSSDDKITNSIFLNIYPSLYDSLIDIHIYQKLSTIYGTKDEVDPVDLLNKKKQIYSIKRLKERALSPTLLTVTEFSLILRKNLLPLDFEKKLDSHYQEMNTSIMDLQQDNIVKGQNKLQLILLFISVVALILTFISLDYSLKANLIFSGIISLISIMLYFEKLE